MQSQHLLFVEGLQGVVLTRPLSPPPESERALVREAARLGQRPAGVRAGTGAEAGRRRAHPRPDAVPRGARRMVGRGAELPAEGRDVAFPYEDFLISSDPRLSQMAAEERLLVSALVR